MDSLQINNQTFQIFIQEQEILTRIHQLARQLNADYKDDKPIFLAVLNGSFMFAADLFKALDFACEIQFVKLSSYAGMHSVGKVSELIGLNQSIENRRVVILEDIIDSGLTIFELLKRVNELKPKEVEVCSLLLKPEALQVQLSIKYVGFEVGNEFLLGYGLDFDGLGRNLRHIYQAVS
ncbi:MAG: hypoxanthine phosphoribosyltransferase [Bacteroidia bacterium]|nr:hypoxanthine phosphoribosyltransferase [Bacteroidia bacterium]